LGILKMVKSGAHDYSELYKLFKEPDITVVLRIK
jgi:hypothetical protein